LVDKSKQKEGVTSLDWNLFLSNIKNLEIETDILSDNRFLLADLAFHNALFSEEKGKLFMTDPGRYHHVSFFTTGDYKRRNQLMLADYFKHMLERDIIHFKLVNKGKTSLLVNNIVREIGDSRYSLYFESVASDYESVHEFLKTKGITAKFKLAFNNMKESAHIQHQKDVAAFNEVKAKSLEDNREFVEFLHTKGLKAKVKLVIENIKKGAKESNQKVKEQIEAAKKGYNPNKNITAEDLNKEFNAFLKQKGLDNKYVVTIEEVNE